MLMYETYEQNRSVTIGGNNTILVTGTNDLEVNGVNTEIYKKSEQ